MCASLPFVQSHLQQSICSHWHIGPAPQLLHWVERSLVPLRVAFWSGSLVSTPPLVAPRGVEYSSGRSWAPNSRWGRSARLLPLSVSLFLPLPSLTSLSPLSPHLSFSLSLLSVVQHTWTSTRRPVFDHLRVEGTGKSFSLSLSLSLPLLSLLPLSSSSLLFGGS